MRSILLFYLFPNRIEKNKSKDELFKFSLILYLVSVSIFSVCNYFLGTDEFSKTFNTNKIVFNLIGLVVLLFDLPFKALIFTIVGWCCIKLLLKTKLNFLFIYKILFISLGIIVFYYLFETINLFLFNITGTKPVNIFSYSLNDLFFEQLKLMQSSSKYFSRITTIIILSTLYFYYILKSVGNNSNIKLLIVSVITICTTLLIFIGFRELTLYLVTKAIVA